MRDKQKDDKAGCKHQFELVEVPESAGRKSSLAVRALDAFEVAEQINETGEAVFEIVRGLETIEGVTSGEVKAAATARDPSRRSRPNTATT
ncbi:hypothetical protein [Williamsia sp. M5A3_1d]